MTKDLSRRLAELIKFVEFTDACKAVERTTWFRDPETGRLIRERVAEHSWQLAMAALFLNEFLTLGLRPYVLLMYASVHDVVERYARDTPAFAHPDEPDAPVHDDKEEREHAAFERIKNEWGEQFSTLVQFMEAYEAQGDEEARFIKALDKLLPAISIMLSGGKTNHEVGVSFDDAENHRGPRVQCHDVVATLYAALVPMLEERKEELYPKPKGGQ